MDVEEGTGRDFAQNAGRGYEVEFNWYGMLSSRLTGATGWRTMIMINIFNLLIDDNHLPDTAIKDHMLWTTAAIGLMPEQGKRTDYQEYK